MNNKQTLFGIAAVVLVLILIAGVSIFLVLNGPGAVAGITAQNGQSAVTLLTPNVTSGQPIQISFNGTAAQGSGANWNMGTSVVNDYFASVNFSTMSVYLNNQQIGGFTSTGPGAVEIVSPAYSWAGAVYSAPAGSPLYNVTIPEALSNGTYSMSVYWTGVLGTAGIRQPSTISLGSQAANGAYSAYYVATLNVTILPTQAQILAAQMAANASANVSASQNMTVAQSAPSSPTITPAPAYSTPAPVSTPSVILPPVYSGSPLGWILIGLAMVGLIGVGGYLVIRRR